MSQEVPQKQVMNQVQNQSLSSDPPQIPTNQTSENPDQNHMIGMITHQIQQEIIHSQLQISNKKQKLPRRQIQAKIRQQQIKADQKKIADIINRRRQLQDQMKRLKYEQSEQKQKMRESTHSNSPNKTFRSKFNKTDQEQIDELKKASEEFEQSMITKSKKLEAQIEQQKKKEIKERKLMIEKLKEQKHIEVEKNMIKMKVQHEKKLQKIHEENKQFQKIKKEPTGFQKIQEMQKSIEKLKKEKQKEAQEQKRRQHQLNMEEIRKHQKKYYEMIKAKKAQTQRLLVEREEKASQKQRQYMTHYRKSKFLQQMIDEQHQKAQQQKLKIRKLQQIKQRKTTFGQSLRREHRQRLNKMQQETLEKQKKQRQLQQKRLKARSMSSEDIYKLGQQNMMRVHSQLTPQDVESSKIQLSQYYESLKDQSDRIKYEDYLQAQKQKRKSLDVFRNSSDKLHEKNTAGVRELREIMKRSQSEKDKLYQAKLVAEKLEQKSHRGSNTNMMINSIAAKLEIINQFV